MRRYWSFCGVEIIVLSRRAKCEMWVECDTSNVSPEAWLNSVVSTTYYHLLKGMNGDTASAMEDALG